MESPLELIDRLVAEALEMPTGDDVRHIYRGLTSKYAIRDYDTLAMWALRRSWAEADKQKADIMNRFALLIYAVATGRVEL